MGGITITCTKCGKEYVLPINYDGSLKGVFDFMKQLQIDVDCNCECGEVIK